MSKQTREDAQHDECMETDDDCFFNSLAMRAIIASMKHLKVLCKMYNRDLDETLEQLKDIT